MIFLFLGLPSSFEKVLAILTGLVIIAFAYRLRLKDPAQKADTYVDSAATPPAAQNYQASNAPSNDVSK